MSNKTPFESIKKIFMVNFDWYAVKFSVQSSNGMDHLKNQDMILSNAFLSEMKLAWKGGSNH